MLKDVFAEVFTMHGLIIALLLIIGVTEVFGQVPQTWRVFKSRDSGGLSSFSMGISLCNYVLWSVYYFSRNLDGLLLVNTAAGIVYALMVAGAVRAGIPIMKAAAFASVYLGLTVVFFIYAPLTLPMVLLCGAGFMFYSAAWAAFRSTSIAGISPLTWTGLLLCGVASVGLGLVPGERDLAVAAWGAIAASASALILAIVFVKSRKARTMAMAVLHDAEDMVEEAFDRVRESFACTDVDDHVEDCVCA